MSDLDQAAVADRIINRATSLGASLAGIASVEELKEDKKSIRIDGEIGPIVAIKFCRLCEPACPVGKPAA